VNKHAGEMTHLGCHFAPPRGGAIIMKNTEKKNIGHGEIYYDPFIAFLFVFILTNGYIWLRIHTCESIC